MNSMKNLISIFLLSLLINFKSFGQGNLVFNNTIYKEFSHYNPGTTLENVGTFTVPTGKVWKIESILNSIETDPISSPGSIFAGGGSWSIKKQGENVFHTIKQGDAAQSDIIWLNTGTYQLNLYKTPANNYKFNLLLTGIEFNLVP